MEEFEGDKSFSVIIALEVFLNSETNDFSTLNKLFIFLITVFVCPNTL